MTTVSYRNKFTRSTFVTLIVTLLLCYQAIDKLLEARKPFLEINSLMKEEDAIDSVIFNLGYGGFIHNFKNYVIRKDQRYYQDADSNYHKLKNDLVVLKKHNDLTAKIEIAKIEETLDIYRQKLETAKSLIERGKSSEAIDKVVFVDDSIALESLHRASSKLHHFIIQNIEKSVEAKEKRILIFGLWAFLLIAFLFSAMFYEFFKVHRYDEVNRLFMREVFNQIKTPIFVVKGGKQFRFNNAAADKFWSQYSDRSGRIEEEWFDFLLSDKMKLKDLASSKYINQPLTFVKRFTNQETGEESIFEMSVTVSVENVINDTKYGVVVLTDRSKLIDNNSKAEIHHRIKNNLSLLIGLAEIMKREYIKGESRAQEDIVSVLNTLVSKIYSISTIYDNEQEVGLQQKVNLLRYFIKLFEQHRGLNQQVNMKSQFEISDDLYISSKELIPLGLIFSEFLVNSIKYAKVKDELIVGAKIYFTNKGIVADFFDNGMEGDLPESIKETGGMGRRIIDILALQLNSSVNFEFNNGARLSLVPSKD